MNDQLNSSDLPTINEEITVDLGGDKLAYLNWDKKENGYLFGRLELSDGTQLDVISEKVISNLKSVNRDPLFNNGIAAIKSFNENNKIVNIYFSIFGENNEIFLRPILASNEHDPYATNKLYQIPRKYRVKTKLNDYVEGILPKETTISDLTKDTFKENQKIPTRGIQRPKRF